MQVKKEKAPTGGTVEAITINKRSITIGLAK